MAASLVQHAVATGTGTAPACSFAGASTAGNLIVAKVAYLSAGGTLSMPAGFGKDVSYGPASPQVSIWSYPNAPATTTVTGSLSGSSARWILAVEEWSGLQGALALDQTADATGSGASGSSGTTSATTQAAEMAAAAIAADDGTNGDGEFSSPTNGYTLLENKANGNPLALATLYKVLSATGAQSTAVNCSTSPDYYGVIATYKAASVGYDFTTTQAGDWGTGSTWVGGTAPTQATIKGKFLKIAHAVTIDPTTVPAIGASGSGNGVARIDINASGASLSLANTNAALTITFNSSGSNPVGTTNGPTGGAASSNAPGSDATMLGFNIGQGTLNLVGSAANPVTITSQDDSSPIYIRGSGWGILGDLTNLVTNITLKYCVIKHCGINDSTNAIFYGIVYDGRGGGVVDIENCKFVDPYDGLRVINGGGSFAGVTFNNNWFSGTVRGINGCKLAAGTPTSGVNTVSGNTWDNPNPPSSYTCITLQGPSAVADDNTCYNSTNQSVTLIDVRGITTGPAPTVARNLIVNPSTNSGSCYIVNAKATGCLGTITDAVGFYVYNAIAAQGNLTVTNCYGRAATAQAGGQGAVSIGTGGASTFANCIAYMESGNNYGLLAYNSATLDSGAQFTIDHCTFYSPANASNGVGFGDGSTLPCYQTRCRSSLFVGLNQAIQDSVTPANDFGHAGTAMTTDGSGNATPDGWTPTAADVGLWVQITATGGGWTNNALYKVTGASGGTWQLAPLGSSPAVPLSATSGHYNFWGQQQYTIDTPPGCGVHHNAFYNNTAVYAAVNNGFGTPGFTDGANLHPSATYGDLSGTNPNFVDTTRTHLTWSTSLGGAGTIGDLMGNFSNRSGLTGASFNSSYGVDKLRQYLFAGFAPQAAALSGVSYDAGSPLTSAGSWMGAVAGAAGNHNLTLLGVGS
jgi:hypothetical protein